MARLDDDPISPDDLGPVVYSEEANPLAREQDGVASLHDREAEVGDEEELADDFVVDRLEARSLGVQLDSVVGPEAQLD